MMQREPATADLEVLAEGKDAGNEKYQKKTQKKAESKRPANCDCMLRPGDFSGGRIWNCRLHGRRKAGAD